MNKLEIFVDLDGVLADWDTHASGQLFGGLSPRDFEAQFGNVEFWNRINSAPGFWETIPTYDYSWLFWNFLVVNFDKVNILTSPGKANPVERCVKEKLKWVEERKWQTSRDPGAVIVQKDKAQYARPDAVLIDDFYPNILAWRKAGGIGIYFEGDWTDAADKLIYFAHTSKYVSEK